MNAKQWREKIESRSMPLPWSGCDIWMGPTNGIGAYGRGGYGLITTDGIQMYVHRLAYELNRGPIPEGKMVCHHCDVRTCINPDHLFISDAKGNHDDKVEKGRARAPGAKGDANGTRKYPWIVRGENNGRALLTWEIVKEIRAAYSAGECQRTLAQKYGIGQSQVSRICRGQQWV